MNDIIPNSTESCQVDWCQQPPGHALENHVRHVGVVEPTPFNNNVQAVIVTIEAGYGEVDPLPVLTLAGDGESFRRSVRLEWSEAAALAGLLARTVESHVPDAVVQPGQSRVATVNVSTDHEASAWEHALLRLGASGTLEATGTAIVVEHDSVDETVRVHAPARTELDRVREIVRAAAVHLGVMR